MDGGSVHSYKKFILISLPLRFSQGHFFTELAGEPWLLDTGGPQSFGRPSNVTLGSRTFPVSPSYAGLTPEQLSGFVGEPCAGLLGMDILAGFHLTLNASEGTLLLSSQPPPSHGTRIHLRFLMGIPILEAEIDGSQQSLFFDTGAQHSYWQSDRLHTFPSQGVVPDFYPGFGRFETPIHRVPVNLAGKAENALFGRLPDLLGMTLKMAGVQGILGNEVCRRRRLTLRFPENCVDLD